MTTSKSCRTCSVPLIVGTNWPASGARNHNYQCRACNTARVAQSYHANIDRARETQRTYKRKWYADNRAEVREAQRQRRAANPEPHRESTRKWHAANPDGQRRWREANPEKARALEQARRAREADAPQGCRHALRAFEAARWIAARIFGEPVHPDHIVPLSRGGAHAVENLRWIPARWNLHKHAKLDSAVTDPEFRAWLDSPPYFERVTYVTHRGRPAPTITQETTP